MTLIDTIQNMLSNKDTRKNTQSRKYPNSERPPLSSDWIVLILPIILWHENQIIPVLPNCTYLVASLQRIMGRVNNPPQCPTLLYTGGNLTPAPQSEASTTTNRRNFLQTKSEADDSVTQPRYAWSTFYYKGIYWSSEYWAFIGSSQSIPDQLLLA